jgi:hypothetical protein
MNGHKEPMPVPVALWLAIYAAAGLIALAGVLVFVARADAHSWYGSTKDPATGLGCCGGEDCAEIADADVKAAAGGYVCLPTGEFIPMARVQQSPDWFFHRCEYLSTFDNGLETFTEGQTRCFFAPAGSM